MCRHWKYSMAERCVRQYVWRRRCTGMTNTMEAKMCGFYFLCCQLLELISVSLIRVVNSWGNKFPGREINFPGLVRDLIDWDWVRQFSPAVIVNVIAPWPLLPWTAADHQCAWHVPHPRARMHVRVGGHTTCVAVVFVTCHFWRLQRGGLVTDYRQTASQ